MIWNIRVENCSAAAWRVLCTISKLTVLQGYIKETVLLPAGSRDAEGSDLHRGSHHKRSFRRITDCKLLMHETTVHDRLVLQHNLIAVAALQSLLISVAFMGTVLHLLKIPYHTEFSHWYNYVAFLFPILCDLKTQISTLDNIPILRKETKHNYRRWNNSTNTFNETDKTASAPT